MNPLIALSGKPLQFQAPQSPMNRLAKVMELSSSLDQSDMNRMRMDEIKRGQAESSAISEAYKNAVGPDGSINRNALYSTVASQGYGSRIPGMQKQFLEVDDKTADIGKKKADTDKTQIEVAHKRVDSWGQAMGYVRQNPTPQAAAQAVQHLVNLQVMPPQMAEAAIAQIQQDPSPENITKWATMGFQAALSAKDQLPKYDSRNLGGSTQMTATDPVTGQVRVVDSAQNTATPGDLLSDARGKEQLAISRGQLAVSQGNLRVSQGRLDLERGNSVADAGGPNQVPLVKRFGKPPQGYRWNPDGTMEAVPGGPADIKAGELGDKRARQQRAAVEQAERVISKVDQALDRVGMNTAGLGSVLSSIPGTDAKNLQTTLDTIKANLGFAELQAMREASPTGGALGAIAVQELIALQSTVASLDQGQSPEQLRNSLAQIKTHYQNWKQAVQNGGAAAGGKPAAAPSQGPARVASDADYNALPSGAEFIAPDGSRRRKP